MGARDSLAHQSGRPGNNLKCFVTTAVVPKQHCCCGHEFHLASLARSLACFLACLLRSAVSFALLCNTFRKCNC
eukprot:5805838-Amphidinium_carterae.1